MDKTSNTDSTSRLMYHHLAEQVMDIIRARQLKPHEPVPSEGELSKRFKVSRMTAKLALETLAKQGIVYRLPRRGTFLADAPLPADLQAVADAGGSGQAPSQEDRAPTLIAIVVPNLDEYIGGIVAAVESELRQHQAELVVVITASREDEAACLERLVRQTKAAGILLFSRGGLAGSAILEELRENRYPLVLLDRLVRGMELDSVCHDHFYGVYQLMRLLLQKGHRQIGYLSTSFEGVSSREERYQAYVQAHLDHGLPIRTGQICLEAQLAADPREANRTLQAFLASNPQLTALVCVNDYLAAQAYYTCKSLHISVPDRLSIVGFCDHPVAAYVPVPLTTARQSAVQLGQSAVRLLMSRIGRSKEGALTVKLRTPIVERESVKDMTACGLRLERQCVGGAG
ncbi:GntR family transcriptional regulator [Paenibacillus sp. J31TS4]|uniref:GntR family transcriptional regulator n=1 Tax=Paenibacillus sp. J31TS4 TaxID=2807195 RepID=UPI001BD0112B|nr:GntR family transcriptional regulator [Paenibacillus sp. J31TS4]